MKKYLIKDYCRYPDFPLNILFRTTSEKKGHYFYEEAHKHDFIEIIYILNGSGWMCFNEQKVPCFPGDIYILPLGTLHEFKVLTSIEYYNLLIHPRGFTRTELITLKKNSFFDSLFSSEYVPPIFCRLPFPETADLRYLLALSSDWAKTGNGEAFRLRLKSYMILILFEILSLIVRSEKINKTTKPQCERSTQNISLIVDYMIRHFREPLTIQQLAKKINMSSAGFIRFFRKQNGLPPIQYLNKIRIYEACRMLTEKKKGCKSSIAEVAYACGFSNSSYFAEIFRKVLDLSPGEFIARTPVSRR